MLFTAQTIPYASTNQFSKIVLDYLQGENVLKPFYTAAPDIEAIKKAIAAKQAQNPDRETLVQVLQKQYEGVEATAAVQQNIQALLQPNTFTVCTAHQPNLFTGPLYFIYKILHAVQLAQQLSQQLPQHRFVPVFYMGSEDADKEELLHTYVQGKKYEWQTTQTGAVGRMIVDKALVALIDEMSGQLLVHPFGKEVVDGLKASYAIGTTIQQATFSLVNALFGNWGLIVLIADSADLKKKMIPVFEDDLFQQQPSQVVEATVQKLGEHYNVQANPRDINLFYLKDNLRERIVKKEDHYCVNHTDIRFTKEELQNLLQEQPELFSPNVILRGLYQETILPNVAFIGGGGEVAYWLQLKDLFTHYNIPFPLLVLRNSFLIIEKKWAERISKLDLDSTQLFLPPIDLLNALVEAAGQRPQLNGELQQLSALYDSLKSTATAVDITLQGHVEALKVQALNKLQTLEKKMLRAERNKHQAVSRQIAAIKEELFPRNGLQERVENFATFYAKWGPQFIEALLQHSLGLEQQFTVLTEVQNEA